MLQIAPVALEGEYVRLVPLEEKHADGLFEAGKHQEIWTYMSLEVHSIDDINQFINTALLAQRNGTELPFTIIDKRNNTIIGSTRFMNIAHKDRGLEIGTTWLTPSVWKSVINTECKWLLMRHCFEQLGCIRVQLKTDARNLNSQRAIARIGGVKEGILRNHMITRTGYFRDTVFFSIIDKEWETVDQKLRDIIPRVRS